ncbi:hypothetical protein NQ318_009829 [Aromia moschata]|uniref:Uncharacterized protein n=1 Tax=Aromia moschata TaxID=1265417 RepID=A0AAV8XMG5_9CUCU|nr:hypothetical protein NQ318_009829 [Aromia moschata]
MTEINNLEKLIRKRAVAKDDNPNDHEQERQTFENDYFKYEAMARRLLNPQVGSIVGESGANSNSINVNSVNEKFNIKLPTINLPVFDGSYENWLYFKDTFNSIVHANKAIADGEAADLIKSLEVSSANYNAAWQLINDRYENKNLLVNNHVKALFNLPAVSKESHVFLRSLLDKLNKSFKSIKGIRAAS